MGSAAKRQIGFVTDQKENKQFSRKDVQAEGPIINLLRIRITPYQLKMISPSKFVKLMLRSENGRVALDMVLKDSDSSLVLVPRSMPAISISMNAELFESLEGKTIVMLEDGAGKNKGYAIAALREVELMNDGKWTPAKKQFVN